MRHLQLHRAQHQQLSAAVFPQKSILCAVTMARVAKYWVPLVLHVAAQLVCASSLGLQLNFRKTTTRITTHWYFDLGLF